MDATRSTWDIRVLPLLTYQKTKIPSPYFFQIRQHGRSEWRLTFENGYKLNFKNVAPQVGDVLRSEFHTDSSLSIMDSEGGSNSTNHKPW